MKGLLVLTAILLLVAGLVKLRAAERMGLGLAVLPLVEVVAGLGMGAVSWLRPPTPGGGLVMVILAVGLILLSSIQVGLAVQARLRIRRRSEATRLRTFLALRPDGGLAPGAWGARPGEGPPHPTSPPPPDDPEGDGSDSGSRVRREPGDGAHS